MFCYLVLLVYFFSINIWTRPALSVRDERFSPVQVCQRARWLGERICKGTQETSGQVSQHRGIWSAYCESEKKLSFRNKKMQINTFCKVYSKRQKERCSAWVFTDILLQVINRDNCVQIQIQIHIRIYNCNQAPSMWGWLPSWSAWVTFRITWYAFI